MANDDENWCSQQREVVIDYLISEGFAAPEVGAWPAWYVAPFVAVWAVESEDRPGWVGWWAISGDLPTDYTSCGPERHPREALESIGSRWSEAADAWAKGGKEQLLGGNVGSDEDQKALYVLLGNRAKVLLEWSRDDAIWQDL